MLDREASAGTTTQKEVLLSDYVPPSYRTESVELSFDINDGATVVTSKLYVRREDSSSNELYLNGQELELVSISLDGRMLSANEFVVDEDGLTLPNLGAEHQIEIVTRIKPEENTALEGLYKSSQMYCTQCEAEGFRKITYFQDRPDVLAKYTTTIIADGQKFPTLLSNGNLVRSEEADDGRKKVTWQDPFPKPSYLFALVAGDLSVIEDAFTTMSGREVVLRIYSEPHNIEQCHYAMDVLKRSMRWDEERFGREYDLDIFMIVAVEDFNMGAMENKGLNIFNTSCVLATPDTATDAAYQRVEAVVAHEYFHNWSGNRVTCRDWFQLSLKEGFTVFRDAEFSGDMNSKAVKRIEDVGFLRTLQFAEDAGPLAHAVRPESYLEISNFYTTTIYEKGAEVVGMYETLLGKEKFRQGSDLYFDRFDGAAATTDDFAAAMSEVSGVDLTQFKLWYEQAGTPEVSVEESFSGDALKLSIAQTCPPTPRQENKKPFHMPILIGLLDERGNSIDFNDVDVECADTVRVVDEGMSLLLELRQSEVELKVAGVGKKPVVSFLRDFSAPIKVTYQRPIGELGFLVEHDVNGFIRWDALQTLWVEYFETDSSEDLVALTGKIAAQALAAEEAETQQLLALMLHVPEISYLFEALSDFEVDALLERRDALLASLAQAHSNVWASIYEKYSDDLPFRPDSESAARRALKNIAFEYVVRSSATDEKARLVNNHYERADNLTDRRAALRVSLLESDFPKTVREALLADFYNKWQNEALVIDLWFNLQAQSPVLTLDEVKRLETHEAFEMKNPNRARAVFSVFGMLNHKLFHAVDGSGYKYLADIVARMDELNPQIAARMCIPLTQWRRYDELRQERMQDALKTLSLREDMSKDLYEMVSKALA